MKKEEEKRMAKLEEQQHQQRKDNGEEWLEGYLSSLLDRCTVYIVHTKKKTKKNS